MAASSRRRCLNDVNAFCYICGEYTFELNRKTITDFLKQVYFAYFKVKLGDQDKPWAPHIVCKTCLEHLRQWTKKSRKGLKFAIPMVWREPKDHYSDCYFCAVKTTGINRKNKKTLDYPNLASAIRPVPHSLELPIPVFEGLPELNLLSDVENDASSSDSTPSLDKDSFHPAVLPRLLFSQGELNDLVRDLSLSKESSELLASRLKEKNMLEPGTQITFYRKRHTEFLPYFSQESDIVYCSNVEGLLSKLGITKYEPQDWRFFIDSCKRSLKCVLLHNGNAYGSVPLAHSTTLKEKYDEIKYVLEKISYYEHNWVICVDLKMVGCLLGLQGGYTKYPCFLCYWDSRARDQHWIQQDWPTRSKMVPGEKNILTHALVERSKIIFPPLHIKLGIMKQFVKALPKDGDCFKYICKKFPRSTTEKLKAGIFDGPQIRKLIQDPNFLSSMNKKESCAWDAFVLVVKNFLGNKKPPTTKSLW